MDIKFEQLHVHDSTIIEKNLSDNKEKWIGSYQMINTPVYQAEGTKVFGYVTPYGGDTWPSKDEAEAYARLFAASPKLLGMTKTLIDQLTNGDYPYYPSIVDEIEQFIEKIKSNG